MNSVSKERSNNNSNYHNIKYTILVTETVNYCVMCLLHVRV